MENVKTYYIYHIPGVKIGCSYNVQKRMTHYKKCNFEILETYSDIYKASDREIELQKQYGYKVDNLPYWKTLKNRNNKGCSRGGKTSGNQNVESGHIHKLIQLCKKPIIQFDKEGNKIKEWDSCADAARELGLISTNITGVLKGRRKSTHGYTFKYKH